MNKFYFKKIKENELEPEKLCLAKKMLAFCKEKLRLPDEVYIQWTRAVDKASFEFDKLIGKYLENLNKIGTKSSICSSEYFYFSEEFWGKSYSKLSDRKNEIVIRADIPLLMSNGNGILHVIAHECRHVRDNLDHSYEEHMSDHWRLVGWENSRWEKRAEDFADKTIKEFIIQEGLKLPENKGL